MRQRLRDLADRHRRFGHPRLHILLRREGFRANHKKTHRLYCEEKLQVLKRKQKRRTAVMRQLDTSNYPPFGDDECCGEVAGGLMALGGVDIGNMA
ncbi:MAG: transposase [Roseibium sp.]|nr:transposase [Roseibium sp.]